MLRRLTVLALFTSLIAAGAPAASASSDRVGNYIVVLRDSVGDPRAVAREHARSQNARLGYVYEHALKGYSAKMSDVAAARIASDRRVSYVEADGVVHKVATQTNATWGLDRIDQRALPRDGSYTYTPTGVGVRAYIIDSGISSHTEFTGRLAAGTTVINDGYGWADCDGHGTHVAGTVGGSIHGVAKQVTLVPVRVLNCSGSGTWSGVIEGVDWVTANAPKPAVANMSLGGGYSSAVNKAVEGSVAAGITYAVAAGNGNQGGKAQDACNYSPASAPNALTVGATNSSDTKASWSNYGTCVDLFAPGVGITSTTMDGKTATWSGTSMASPHVAGVAALYLQGDPTASAAKVAAAIGGSATADVVSSAGSGSPNLLLYSPLTPRNTTPPPPDNVVPTVTIDSPTDGSMVSGATVGLAATAGDLDGSVTKVEFYVDAATAPFATDSNGTDGWTAAWDSTSVTDGGHTLRAVATDNGGATGSHSVGVTVENIADPPPGSALTASVAASQSTKKGPWYHVSLTVTVTDGSAAVSGATVALDVLDGACPGGGTPSSGSGTTDSSGTVTFTFKTRSQGTFCASASATKDGYTAGAGETTFTT